MSQRKMAEELEVSESAYQNYEYGNRDLPGDVIARACKKFGCNSDWLIGLTESDIRALGGELVPPLRGGVGVIKPSYSCHVVPMLGNVVAGEWREVYEQDGETVAIPDGFAETNPHAFGVTPQGESMNKLFRSDEIAICDPDLEVRDGDVALVGVNGDEATIKRVYFAGNTIVLHAETTMEDEYPDRAIDVKDPASPSVYMIGRVFWKTLPAREVKF